MLPQTLWRSTATYVEAIGVVTREVCEFRVSDAFTKCRQYAIESFDARSKEVGGFDVLRGL